MTEPANPPTGHQQVSDDQELFEFVMRAMGASDRQIELNSELVKTRKQIFTAMSMFQIPLNPVTAATLCSMALDLFAAFELPQEKIQELVNCYPDVVAGVARGKAALLTKKAEQLRRAADKAEAEAKDVEAKSKSKPAPEPATPSEPLVTPAPPVSEQPAPAEPAEVAAP